MDIILNKKIWKVKGFWPYVPLLGKSMELGNELMGVTDWIDATVPGGVHYDLLKAGLIEEPYFELNSLKCEWVEHRWWMYKTNFSLENTLQSKKLSLIFKGVDYKAHFYLNREKLGEHEGMFESIAFDVTDKVNYESENELVVLCENAPHEMSQIGYTSKTRTQKSRFGYKWDFGTRLVNIGIWDDVILEATGDFTINDTFIATGVENRIGFIKVSSSISGKQGNSCTVKVFVVYDGEKLLTYNREISFQENEGYIAENYNISNPRLWYPNGVGGQPLYHVKIEVYQDGQLSDAQEYCVGIRKLEYRQNQESPEDALPYTVVVNGTPVYIKGVNLSPFDLLYGNVTNETYEKYVMLIKNANINLVRVNGVGIIEKDYFYHLCDVHGIMVWQDFIQSSSGIENVPSIESHFLELLKATAVHAVKQKRNHVCHTIWCGGNELMDENNMPIIYGHPNIKMLKEIVEEYDPGKLYVPSTASGPNFGLNLEQPGRNHDVHGSWKYEGIEKHYKMYNSSDCLFHSEFGVDGCSSLSTLKKFLSKNNVKITDMKENLVWRHHGEWWDTLARDQEIFGKFVSLEQFVKASQFIQAEGIRYIVEANRRRKFKNSGSMVWQFNEPWPNVSNTCMVDYYGIPKMAYYWLKKAYAPIHASLKYEKLFYAPSEEFRAEIFIHNSLCTQELVVVWEILDVCGQVIRREEVRNHVLENSASWVKDIAEMITETEHGIFFVRLEVYDSSGKECCRNLYTFSQKEKKIFTNILGLEKGSLRIEKTDQGYRIRNIGGVVCLFIHGIESTGNKYVFIDNNYCSLFPGEEQLFTVYAVNMEELDSAILSIIWEQFNK